MAKKQYILQHIKMFKVNKGFFNTRTSKELNDVVMTKINFQFLQS